jgi:hypothetical protein
VDVADRKLVRMVLPPLLGLGLVAALTHPLDRGPTSRPLPLSTIAPTLATPQHTDGTTP